MNEGRTAVELIQAGAEADPDDIAEALAMGDGDFRNLLKDLAHEGEDEYGWVTLFSRGLIKRTRDQLAVIQKGMARAAEAAYAAGTADGQRWQKANGALKHAIGARIAQSEWAVQQLNEHDAQAELEAILKVLKRWRVAANSTLASKPDADAKRMAYAHLDVIHAVDKARKARREVKAALLAAAERAEAGA